MRPSIFDIRSAIRKAAGVLLTACCAATLAFAQSDGSQQNKTGRPGTFAIIGARIYTVSGGVIENGTLIIRDGKIAGVGAGIPVPSGAERIDGKGLSVFPGMIDANTQLGLAEIPLGAGACRRSRDRLDERKRKGDHGHQSAFVACKCNPDQRHYQRFYRTFGRTDRRPGRSHQSERFDAGRNGRRADGGIDH
ncbi:MAG: amidohydrolase family protein [Pyrinomonadaceae bacterium]